ncbi:MAG: hypothetical protein JXA21_21000 [Anaerolineae bacterium]|nr:hypothetical protein [Anaerolineae bacterium]
MKTKILMIALALALAVTGVALASNGVERPRWVLSGGASDAAAGSVALRATLGQPIIGVTGGGEVMLGQGFWHGGSLAESGHSIYLPLVMRAPGISR